MTVCYRSAKTRHYERLALPLAGCLWRIAIHIQPRSIIQPRGIQRVRHYGFLHAQVCVAALGASNDTFAAATWTPGLAGCIGSRGRALACLGGAPQMGVPDTLRAARHPARRAIFAGDLVDRGPASPAVLRLAMNTVRKSAAFCVSGNHDVKLMRKLRGRDVRLTHGLAETLEQTGQEPDEFSTEVADFIDVLVSHLVLDDGNSVVAPAGLSEELQGRASAGAGSSHSMMRRPGKPASSV